MSQGTIAVVGATGQVAQALVRRARDAKRPLVARGRPDVDLNDIASVERYFDEVRPAVVVNAAAYTAVDRAESEPEDAFALNSEAPARLAAICAARGLPLIHLSTDYVFDGMATEPYREDQPPHPMNAYGASKAAGEMAVASACPHHIILRTAWVYGLEGQNFVRTMLRLGAERDELGIVADQRGSPTFADDIADAVLKIAEKVAGPDRGAGAGVEDGGFEWGVVHFTNSGETTWHEFAEAIFAHARAAGRKLRANVKAISTDDYPTPARRPSFSVLDCTRLEREFGVVRPCWREALARAMPLILATSPQT